MSGRALRNQARAEVVMTLRRGESLLLAVGIPAMLLVFFSLVDVLPVPTGTRHNVDFLAPGVLALAVMSTGLVSLAIATGFERSYGVLKRLGTTPLSRRDLLVAKTAGVLVVEAIQVVVLSALALTLGWRPSAGAAAGLGVALLATAAFSGLGLLMAGALEAELTLALSNGLYLVLLLLGGMVIPLSSLPRPLRLFAEALPASALADGLRASIGLGHAVPLRCWLVLAAWAVLAPAAAALTFRWE